MASEEYAKEWREKLDKYQELVKANQAIRNKFVSIDPNVPPTPLNLISKEEIESLDNETKAWEEFLELARKPY